jgi:NAD(P)-dependent dehydrogenase (short-subunit alcohol dehydrogenase family)
MTAHTGAVLVSGGTFGIGRAISLRLARGGWPVLAFGLEARQPASIAENAIPSLLAEAAAGKLPLAAMEADVSAEEHVARVVETALARFGSIGAVVHNAAIGPLGTVLDTPPALWDRIHAVNLKGAYLLARAALPHLIARGGGAMVMIGSGAGWGKPNMAAYAASKGGLFALAAALAYDHFHQRIRVNTVVPGGGGIRTGMSLGRVGGDPTRLGQGAPGSVAGRPVRPEDVAEAVAFLLSPAAETISGTILDVGCFAHQGGPIPPAPIAQGAAS